MTSISISTDSETGSENSRSKNNILRPFQALSTHDSDKPDNGFTPNFIGESCLGDGPPELQYSRPNNDKFIHRKRNRIGLIIFIAFFGIVAIIIGVSVNASRRRSNQDVSSSTSIFGEDGMSTANADISQEQTANNDQDSSQEESTTEDTVSLSQEDNDGKDGDRPDISVNIEDPEVEAEVSMPEEEMVFNIWNEDDIGTVCRRENTKDQAGRELCAFACAENGYDECCDRDAEDTCFFGNFRSCRASAGCSILNGGRVPPPLSNLDELCKTDGLGINPFGDRSEKSLECLDACAEASCCFDFSLASLRPRKDDEEEDGGSCAISDFLACQNYEPCNKRFSLELGIGGDSIGGVGGGGEDFPEAPDDLIELCDHAVISASEDAHQICEDACSVSTCCYDDADDSFVGFSLGECFNRNPFACVGYSPCMILYDDGKVPPPPLNLNEACPTYDALNLDIPMTVTEECKEACSAGACCTSDDISFNCLAQNIFQCTAYLAPCAAVSLFDEFPPPPADLQDVCSFRSISSSPENRTLCQNYCDQASCCDIPNLGEVSDAPIDVIEQTLNNCVLENIVGCGFYLPCITLSIVSEDDEPPDSVDKIQFADPAVDESCSFFGGNKEDCVEACEPGACCMFNAEDSCKENNFWECNSYWKCSISFMLGSGDPEEIPEDEASEYESDDTIPPPNELYYEHCSVVGFILGGGDDCKDECSKVECCGSRSGSSCYNGNEENCDMYSACRFVNLI
mmetsp:Transcript_35698/g.41367  ORF Transcript_35698/g.41367 Transcript_35698/m.41367 type:complete len:743 (-) Transcript_35698:312-2540(-)|eukprot:CAMPEP_0194373654 /NCGR_PEP_ID=MMETSP0174-20130528/22141_1 /TAXON_ID=216777 /ORGANISM="Proboscia alata, Strain PI-D3" /LENGTH=742 /DNA_ID=CAMNT_0039152885 /DNA_START=28 /DNA_END=2256 /DNA_ORIENTATION=+